MSCIAVKRYPRHETQHSLELRALNHSMVWAKDEEISFVLQRLLLILSCSCRTRPCCVGLYGLQNDIHCFVNLRWSRQDNVNKMISSEKRFSQLMVTTCKVSYLLETIACSFNFNCSFCPLIFPSIQLVFALSSAPRAMR